MSIEILKVSSSADFLAALPQLTGMHAPESLFIVFFKGKRSCGTARIDLPEQVIGDDVKFEVLQWLKTVAEIAQQGDAPALVIHTNDALSPNPSSSRYGALARLIWAVSVSLGFPLRELCVVGTDGWAEFLTGETAPLRSLDEITSSSLHKGDAELLNLADWRDKHPGQSDPIDAGIADRIEERLNEFAAKRS